MCIIYQSTTPKQNPKNVYLEYTNYINHNTNGDSLLKLPKLPMAQSVVIYMKMPISPYLLNNVSSTVGGYNHMLAMSPTHSLPMATIQEHMDKGHCIPLQ